MKVIFCAGEHGRVVLDTLRRSGVKDVAFVDDDDSLWGEEVDGVRVLGGLKTLSKESTDETTVIIGYGRIDGSRLSLAEPIRDLGFDLLSVIDPDATVSERATIGAGVFVNSQSYIGPGVTLGDLVLVDSCVNISHDCELERGVTVAPNVSLSGGVTVGADAYIGTGATILDHLTIEREAVVGAGAVVTKDVPAGETVVGIPARPQEPSD